MKSGPQLMACPGLITIQAYRNSLFLGGSHLLAELDLRSGNIRLLSDQLQVTASQLLDDNLLFACSTSGAFYSMPLEDNPERSFQQLSKSSLFKLSLGFAVEGNSIFFTHRFENGVDEIDLQSGRHTKRHLWAKGRLFQCQGFTDIQLHSGRFYICCPDEFALVIANKNMECLVVSKYSDSQVPRSLALLSLRLVNGRLVGVEIVAGRIVAVDPQTYEAQALIGCQLQEKAVCLSTWEGSLLVCCSDGKVIQIKVC